MKNMTKKQRQAYMDAKLRKEEMFGKEEE